MKATFLLLLFALTYLHCFSDNPIRPVGARSHGLANASVMLSGSSSIFHNQAGLIGITNPILFSGFGNSFMIEELSLKSIGGAFPLKYGIIGANFSRFGYEKYNETTVGLNFAKQLFSYLSLGIGLDYINIHLPQEYGNKNAVAGEIGLLVSPIDEMNIGIHIFNPWRTKIAEYENERLPSVIGFGISYLFSEKLLLAIETEKDFERKPVFKVAFEYQLIKMLVLQTGISTNPVLNSFGIGFKFKKICANLAFSKHPILSYSTNFSINYNFGNKSKATLPE